jgi:hypothetical protein
MTLTKDESEFLRILKGSALVKEEEPAATQRLRWASLPLLPQSTQFRYKKYELVVWTPDMKHALGIITGYQPVITRYVRGGPVWMAGYTVMRMHTDHITGRDYITFHAVPEHELRRAAEADVKAAFRTYLKGEYWY